MVELSESLTRKVADLARLELTDSEIKTFTSQLDDILNYVEQLSVVSVEGVEPLTHPVELSAPLREDRVRPSPTDPQGNPKMLSPAPDVLERGFKVPPIL